MVRCKFTSVSFFNTFQYFQVIITEYSTALRLLCVVSTKTSHIHKQNCSFQVQVCSIMCDLLVDTRHYKIKIKGVLVQNELMNH